MTIKKYYQNGKLASIGFDSLEEVYAYRKGLSDLEEVPSNELELNEGAKKRIQDLKDFQDFYDKIEGGKDK